MWVAYALGSAFFAGLVAILGKIGVAGTSSAVATAIRTVVVLAMAWLMVFVVGSQSQLLTLDGRALVFLTLSGLATGASWLAYFKALQLGEATKVVAIDRMSLVLTVVFAIVWLGETDNLAFHLIAIAVMTVGVLLMSQVSGSSAGSMSRAWVAYALVAAVFAALTSILAKVALADIESNLATALRTIVVLAMAWLVVLVTGERRNVRGISRRDLTFIALSGVATGASWLCFYKALQAGPVSGVVPIDKLSIVVTAVLAAVFLKERIARRSVLGLVLIVAGTIALAM